MSNDSLTALLWVLVGFIMINSFIMQVHSCEARYKQEELLERLTPPK